MRVFMFILFLAWGAQAQDTTIQRHAKPKAIAKIFIAPVVLIGFGLYTKDDGNLLNRYAVRDWRNAHAPHFETHVDDAIQFAPIALVYGLDLFKLKSKDDWLNKTLLLAKSEVLMNVMVHALKTTTNVTRPDGSTNNSFPSGHTAHAFMAATFMHKELGEKSVWFSISAYTMATSVAVFRVMNNRHWISDVLAGAGFGILSTNMVYATHRYRWGKRPNLTVLPIYSNGPGLYLALKLGN
jgi:membrane-associated phospholipid phosphatase